MDPFFLIFFIPVAVSVVIGIAWIMRNKEKSVWQQSWKLLVMICVGIFVCFAMFVGFGVLYYMGGGH